MPTFRVSTRSRPKAAGSDGLYFASTIRGFNTQPPEGGWEYIGLSGVGISVSTRSRPKAAGPFLTAYLFLQFVSTRSRPKAAGSR